MFVCISDFSLFLCIRVKTPRHRTIISAQNLTTSVSLIFTCYYPFVALNQIQLVNTCIDI